MGSGKLDAGRCISWMTIENRGAIDEAMRPSLGRWVFGCDDCQEVCPHNHKPPTPLQEDLRPLPGLAWLDLEWVLRTPDSAMDQALNGNPLRRCKAWGLKRNAAVVFGNICDAAARPALLHALTHDHDQVRTHARWALDRI